MREVTVLNPWNFNKDEEVNLYWLCSPYLNEHNYWMLRAVFCRSNSELKEIEYPWGNLQLFRYGAVYKNGRILDNKIGIQQEVFVSKLCKYSMCNGFDVPKKLYSMREKFMYGKQKLCHFNVNGMNYYIPCLELVRSLLAPTKTLTNQIMRPYGLDDLTDEIKINRKNLYIDFNINYPTKLVNNDFVYHFIWLKYNKLANNAWNSVYNTVFKTALENSPHEPVQELKKGTYLEVLPPIDKDCRWIFRGCTVGNSTLIFELLSIQGLDMPSFEKVIYSHPSLYYPEPVNEPKTKRNVNKEKENPNELNIDGTGEPSEKNNDQKMIDLPETLFGFNRKPKMFKWRKRPRKLRTGDPGEERPGSGGQLIGEETIVTTQDWALDGEIQPIEFNALDVVKENPHKGLEKFLKVIGCIKNSYKNLDLSLTVVYLPYASSFSVCPNGFRRTCAIVKVSREGQVPCYVIEVGRPDEWPVSTLFLWFIPNDLSTGNLDKIIYRLLQKLAENNGHWDFDFLNQQLNLKFDVGKHVNCQTIPRWKDRIIDKICRN